MTLTGPERDAILTGLRLLQLRLECDELPPLLRDIFTNGDNHPGLEPEELDELCERINCS